MDLNLMNKVINNRKSLNNLNTGVEMSEIRCHTIEMYAFAAKVHLVSLWPRPLTSDLDNLLSNAQRRGEYLCQVSWKSLN